MHSSPYGPAGGGLAGTFPNPQVITAEASLVIARQVFLPHPRAQAASSAAGGLVNWTEAVNTTAPNATIPVASFTVTNGATDVDGAVIVKGGGSLLAAVPNNATAGGNKRGQNAVDLQVLRLAATNVASGNNSTIVGGYGNTSSGSLATCVGGNQNTASNTNSTALGGAICTASGAYAGVGGNGCTASGSSSFAWGEASVASGSYSVTTGLDATTRNLYSARAHASGRQSNLGDIQELRMTLRGNTTDATPKVLTSNNSAASATNQLAVVNFSNLVVMGQVTAGTSVGDSKNWTFSAAILRQGAVGTTAMVAACTPVVVANTVGAAAWALSVTADITNGALAVTFTGAVGASCRIGCTLTSMETGF